MTVFSLGKGVVSLPPGSSSSSMPQVRDPEVKKLLIMPQSLSLSLMGYALFGQASSRVFVKLLPLEVVNRRSHLMLVAMHSD
jgi:hypothetical protein